MKVTKVGIIGCGNISGAYLNGVKQFRNIEIVACADINMEAAKAKSEEFEIKAVTVDEILADKDIEIIITPAIVSNLQTTLKHPTDSKTSTYDWTSTPLINQYDKDSGGRLVVGGSDGGGAGYVGGGLPVNGWNDRGFRLSVVLKST